jgi:ABC-2 type transport system ATP-binding protein
MPESAAPACAVKGGAFSWPDGRVALADIDFRLERGQVAALVGPNGAGKSTLLRILTGLLKLRAGRLEIFGQVIETTSDIRPLRRRISFVAQDPALDPEMNGRETLELIAALQGIKSPALARVIERFGLHEQIERPVELWSGGERRRLHLAAGLLGDPKLILLDEPTVGLDAEVAAILLAELEERKQRGAAIVLVSHEVALIAPLVDFALRLEAGRVVAQGTLAELAAGLPQQDGRAGSRGRGRQR